MPKEKDTKPANESSSKETTALSSIREEITNSYLATLAIVVVTTATIAGGAATYVMGSLNEAKIQSLKNDYQTEIQELKNMNLEKIKSLESRLSEFKRLAGKDDIAHVKDNVLFDPNISEDSIPLSSIAHDDGRFYATSDSKMFKFERIHSHEIEGRIRQTKVNEDIIKSLKERGELKHSDRVFYWSGGPEHRGPSYEIDQHPYYKVIFPHFTIAKIPHGEYTKVTGQSDEALKNLPINLQRLKELRKNADAGQGSEEYIQALNENFFAGDPTGYVLINHLYSNLQFSNIYKAPFTIRRMYKGHGVLYLEITTTLNGIKVNNSSDVRKLYIHQELYAVNTREGVYLLQSFLPSTKEVYTRSRGYSDMNFWWSEFRIKAF